jgi:hypothetical protein
MPKVVLLLAAILAARAQTLHGAIDVHAHCDPDSVARSIDGIALARLAQSRGMRAIVLKNHNESTASLAWLARRSVPGIQVFGGIVLNRAVGGLNPAAIEYMAHVKGGLGRIVWMPTFDAEHQVRGAKEPRSFVAISKDGLLLPETLQVLDLIAKHRLVLATGHSSPEESLLLIRAARARGIRRIVVTHPTLPSIGMTVEQMRRAAVMGAFIEFVYNGFARARPPRCDPERRRRHTGLRHGARHRGERSGPSSEPAAPGRTAHLPENTARSGLHTGGDRAHGEAEPGQVVGLLLIRQRPSRLQAVSAPAGSTALLPCSIWRIRPSLSTTNVVRYAMPVSGIRTPYSAETFLIKSLSSG